MGKPEGKRPLGRPKHRWEDDIKMDLRELSCDPGDWIVLAQHHRHQAYYKLFLAIIKLCTVEFIYLFIYLFTFHSK